MLTIYFPLQIWNKYWRLEGPLVSCRCCGFVQHFTDAGAFSHERDCKSIRMHTQYPLRELSSIIERKIQDKTF
ncbi:hypothetical protein D3C73_538100 [compost metagenome]